MRETQVSLQHRHNELYQEPAKTPASPNILDLEVFSFFAFGGVRRLRDYKIHGRSPRNSSYLCCKWVRNKRAKAKVSGGK